MSLSEALLDDPVHLRPTLFIEGVELVTRWVLFYGNSRR